MGTPDWYDDVMTDFEDELAPMSAEDLEVERRERDSLPERFVPKTDGAFEWAIRKRHRALSKRDEIARRKEEELHILAGQFDRLIAAEQDTANFFDDMIERGILALEPDSKGKRTVKTVAGTAYVRTTEHIGWPADESLVAWCKEHLPAAVIVFEKPDKKALKDAIHETGELPDGVTVEPWETVVVKDA